MKMKPYVIILVVLSSVLGVLVLVCVILGCNRRKSSAQRPAVPVQTNRDMEGGLKDGGMIVLAGAGAAIAAAGTIELANTDSPGGFGGGDSGGNQGGDNSGGSCGGGGCGGGGCGGGCGGCGGCGG